MLPRCSSAAAASAAMVMATMATMAARAVADAPYHTDLTSYQAGALGVEPNQTFRSSPVLAPRYQINAFDAAKVDTASPYLFMAGRVGEGDAWGPSIVSARDLSLVWADHTHYGLTQATHSAELRGERVLVVFVDDAVRIYNERYEELFAVRPVGAYAGVGPDSHEGVLTDDGTVLMIACPAREVDLTGVGGPATGRSVANCLVQEVEPTTNELLFEWTTLDYFDVTDSYWDYHGEGVWDFAHMNSVQKTAEGNFLISYRHLSAIVLVSGATNEVLWVMGGKRNQFRDVSTGGASATFRWQHNPRMTGPRRFTFFDNHRLDNGYCWPGTGTCSRGLEVEYDADARTVRVVNEWTHPIGVVSASRGSVQRTPAGSVLLAWGQNPCFVEYTADGELAMDFQRGQVLTIDHGIESLVAYRVFKGPWVGRPPWGPSIASVADAGAPVKVYVSWNGATEVDQYVMLSSDTLTDLDGAARVVAQSPRNGFETEFVVEGYTVGRYARIAALDASGTILGATPAVDTASGAVTDLDYAVTAVVRAGAAAVAGVPSSARVTVPSGTHAARPPPNVRRPLRSHKLAIILGSIAAACVLFLAAAGAVLWVRRRRARHAASEPSASAAEDAEGLLAADAYGMDNFAIHASDESDDDGDDDETYKDK